MKRHKIGILTLAVTLISLGGILLTKNFGNLNTSLLLSILWPCVIILFGLEIVIGKIIVERNKEDVKMTIDGLSVVLLVIVIVITSIVSSTGAFNFRLNGINIFSDNGIFYTYSSVYKFDYEYDVDNISKIYVDNSYGDVELRKVSGDQLKVHAEISFSHNDEEYADEISKKIVNIDENMDSLSIRTIIGQSNYGGKIGNIGVSYVIEIPNELDADIVNSYGNISIEDCAKQVDINSKHSNVSVRGISGNVNIKNSYGYVDVEEIKGAVDVYNKHGKIDVNQVDNDIIIENSYAQVKVADIEGDVEIINSHNSIDVENILGSIDIDSKYSDIRVEGVNQGIKIINKHGSVRIDANGTIRKFVDIQNDYGDVILTIPESQEGSFKAYVKYGDIHDDFGFNIDENTNEQSLLETIGNSDVKFDLEITHGDLNINN